MRPTRVVVVVMPSGVEHLRGLGPIELSDGVVVVVMPSGVEHQACSYGTSRVGLVVVVVMPSGVEHLGGIIDWGPVVLASSSS